MLAILAPVLVFGLVIFVHELGHFLAAKAVGVYAPRFSIGFGPPIFRFRRGETEYILAWLPLGGYVRMASRHDAETAFLEGGNEEQATRAADEPGYDPEAMIPFGPKPVPENRWFESKPLPARIVIMLAGVFMNVVLAVAVATLFAYLYTQVYRSTVVGGVRADSASAAVTRIQPGDTIRAVNGTSARSWNDVRRLIVESSGSLRITTQRGDVDIPLGDAPDAGQRVAESLQYYLAPLIDTVFAGDPAAAAGLRSGDSIVAVSGRRLRSWNDMVAEVEASPGKPLTLEIRRAGVPETLTVTPKAVTDTDAVTGKARVVGKIGAGSVGPHTERLGIGSAMVAGVQITWMGAGEVFRILRGIGTGATSVRQLGGPIAITRASVDAARNGFDQLLQLISLLSINLAIFNLLPIPILDGGQILINVLESAKGSPFSVRTREYILRFGLAAIALLFVIVMYNDTRAGFAKLFEWVGRLFGA